MSDLKTSTTWLSGGGGVAGPFGSGGNSLAYNARSIQFTSASSQYLSAADANTLDVSNKLTVSCWVYVNNYTSQRTIISKWGAAGNRSYTLHINSSGAIVLKLSTDGTATDETVTSLNKIPTLSWVHVCVVFNAGTVTMYLDSVIDSNTTTSGSAGALFNSTAALQVGAENTGSFFDGYMTNLVLMRHNLVASEVIELYSTGVPTNITSFSQYANVEHWHYLGGGTDDATVCKDYKGTDNLTPVGSAAISSTVPSAPLTYNARSVAFSSASSQYFNRVTNSTLSITNNISISWWEYVTSFSNFPSPVTRWGASGHASFTLFYNNATRKLLWRVSDDGTFGGHTQTLTSSITGTTNIWRHCVASFASGVQHIYFNGVDDSSATVSGTVSSIFDADSDLQIGAETGVDTWDGNMCQVAIWKVALSQTEVTQLYNAGATLDLRTHSQYSNLVSHWYMGGDNDTIALMRDHKGPNLCSANNAPTISTNVP